MTRKRRIMNPRTMMKRKTTKRRMSINNYI
jgi:hypothetical protein